MTKNRVNTTIGALAYSIKVPCLDRHMDAILTEALQYFEILHGHSFYQNSTDQRMKLLGMLRKKKINTDLSTNVIS